MNIFKRIEKSLERLVEDRLAGSFSGEVHPLEIARRMQQALREGRKIGPDRICVPNLFEVVLNPGDVIPLEQMGASFDREMRAYLKASAQEDDYIFLAPVVVRLAADETLPRGRVNVKASFCEDTHAMITPSGGKLTGGEGFDSGAQFDIASGVNLFGRGEGCTYALGDPKASKRHFSITFEKSRFLLRDEGSRNGTLLNGKPAVQHELRSGDTITVGYSNYTFTTVED